MVEIKRGLIRPGWKTGFARNASECHPSARNLWRGKVGHWVPSLGVTGINTLFDVSGHGNHGTMNGSMTLDDWVISGNPRNPGYALSLDGSDDEIDFGNISFGSNDFTWALWFKSNDTSSSEPIIGNARHNEDPGMLIWHTNGPASFRTSDGSGSWVTHTGEASGNWQHIVLRRTGDLLELFLDGVIDATTNTLPANEDIDSGNNFKVGNWVFSNYPGDIYDDVRIYNRALSAQEIWQLYIDPFADLRRDRVLFSSIPAEAVSVDMWHPEIEKPYVEVLEVLAY